jgi:cytochrome c biogenesis protein CcdA
MELTGILAMAFGFGLLHALDADHVLAVSGLSGMRHDGMKSSYTFSIRWALGHGSSILLVGSLVLFLGVAIPQRFSNIAEGLVGFMLLGIGLLLLLDWFRQKSFLYLHRHDRMPLHVHMQPSVSVNPLHHHKHGAVLVGLLHGLAGSAPLLALLPVTNIASPLLGMAYLLIFCLGVMLSMVIFGGLLGTAFAGLLNINRQLTEMLRLLLALITVSFAIYLIIGG